MADYKYFQSIISDHIKAVLALPLKDINQFAADVYKTLDSGGKIIFFGNGGSATQAAHWAEEFVGKFVKKRKPLAAIALGTSVANVTGVANDFGFAEIFSREIDALAGRKDLAVGISTSGRSENVIRGLKSAKKKGIKTWILTGNSASPAKKVADNSICINSDKTARIQELHALLIHMIFELVDRRYD